MYCNNIKHSFSAWFTVNLRRYMSAILMVGHPITVKYYGQAFFSQNQSERSIITLSPNQKPGRKWVLSLNSAQAQSKWRRLTLCHTFPTWMRLVVLFLLLCKESMKSYWSMLLQHRKSRCVLQFMSRVLQRKMMWPLLLKRTATAPRQLQVAPLSPARSPKSEEESQTAVKEDVKQLPSTPSLRISFQRHAMVP